MLHSILKTLNSGNYSIKAVALGIVLFWAALLYVTVGFYFEDHSALALNLQSGLLTDGIPLSDFYIYAQTFTGPIYAFLHGWVPSFPWACAVFYIALFCSSVLIVAVLIHALKAQLKLLPLWQACLGGSLAFLMLLAEVFIQFSGTRVAFMITAASVLGFFWLLHTPLPRKKAMVFLTGFIALFLSGFLIRHEAGLGAIILILPFAYLYTNSIKKILQVYVPVGLFVLVIIFYLRHKSYEIPFLKSIEPEIYLLSDATYKPNFFAGKTPEDSIKYVAIIKNVMTDEGILTAALVKTMWKEKMRMEVSQPAPLSQNLLVALAIARPNLYLYPELLLVNLLLLVIAIAARIYGCTGNKRLLWYVLYQFYFWTIIFTLSFLVKMEPRIFASLAAILTICNFLLVLGIPGLAAALPGWLSRFSHTLLLLTGLVGSLHLYVRGCAQQEQALQVKNILTELQQLAADKMVLVDVDSRVFIAASPLEVIKFPKNKLLLYDNGQLPLLPEYKTYLDKVCQCNSAYMEQFYNFLHNHKNEVVFVARQDRMDFFKTYMELIHHRNYQFKVLDAPTPQGWQLDAYPYQMHYFIFDDK